MAAREVGAVSLKVFPNFRHFHEDLKAGLRKYKQTHQNTVDITVKANTSEAISELEKVDERANELDKRIVELQVTADTSRAHSSIEALRRQEESDPINLRVNVARSSLDTAQRQMDAFKDSNESVTTHVNVQRDHAEMEMEDFRQDMERKTIHQQIKYVPGPAPDRLPSVSPRQSEAMYKPSMTPFSLGEGPSRNVLRLRQETYNAVNFLPKFFDDLTRQFDAGFRQMNDAYIRGIANTVNAIKKPFQSFEEIFSTSKTFPEFFRRIGGGFDGVGPKITSASSSATSAMKRMTSGAKNLSKHLAGVMSRETRAGFSAFGNSIRNIGPELMRLGRATRDGLSTVTAGLKRTRLIGETLPRVFTRARYAATDFTDSAAESFFRFLGHIGQGAALMERTFGVPFYSSFKNIGDSLSGLRKRFDGFFKDVASGSKRARQAIHIGIGQAMSALRELPADIASGFRSLGGAISSNISEAFSILRNGVPIGIFASIDTPLGKAAAKIRGFAEEARDGVVGVFRGFSRIIISPIRNGFASLGRGVGKLTAPLRNSLKTIFLPLDNYFTGFTRRLRGRFSGMGRIMARGLGRVFGSRALYGVFRGVFGRLGNMLGGFTRHALGMFGKLGGLLMKSIVPALGAVLVGVMALGGQAAIGAVMALGGAFMSVASGGLAMLPALAAAGGVAFGALKIGLNGVKSGISAAFSAESVEDFESAIEDLHPKVQEIARGMREFKPAIDLIGDTVQTSLLDGLTPHIQKAFMNLVPAIGGGLNNVAKSWNTSLKLVFDELGSEDASRGIQAIMSGTEDMARAMEPTLRNLTAAFGSLAEQGAKFLGPLGGWINGLSESFFDWAEGMREIDVTTGMSKFDTMIENAKVNAGYLGDIFGGLFGTLGNVFAAGAEGGGGMLAGMAAGLQGLKESTEKGTEGFARMVEFMGSATDAAMALGQIVEPLFFSILEIGGILADLGTAAAPGLGKMLDGLQGGLEQLAPIATSVGDSLGAAFGSLGPTLVALGSALAPVLNGLATGIEQLLTPLSGALTSILEHFAEFGPEIEAVFTSVGNVLGEAFAAATPIVNHFIEILGYMLPVVTEIIDQVGAVFVALFEAVSPLVEQLGPPIQALMQALMPVVTMIGGILVEAIEALQPAFAAIGAALPGIIAAVIPLIDPLGSIIGLLGVALVDAINWVVPLIPPLANLIVGLATNASEILVPAIEWLADIFGTAWGFISDVMSTVVPEVIVPMINWVVETALWLADKITWVVQNVAMPMLSFLGDLFQGAATVISGIITNIIVPVIESILAIFTEVVDGVKWVIDNIFTPILNGLGDIFQGAVDLIKKVWDTVKSIFADPIHAFIDVVVNKGIVGTWNKVVGWLPGLDNLEEVAAPAEMNFASGGVLPGYTPGRDIHNFVSPTGGRLNLSGGEAIMRPEWTQAVGGPAAVEAMNRDAKTGRLFKNTHSHAQGGVMEFANGGVLNMNPNVHITTPIQESMMRAVAAAFPNQIITSGTRYEDVGSGYDNHMAGRALDFGPSQALASWIAQTYPGSAELFWDAGPNLKNGSPTGAIGGHSDHVHWAMANMVDPYTGEVVSQDGPGGGGNPFSAIWGKITDLASGAWDNITSGLSAFTESAGDFVEVPMGLARKAWDEMLDHFTSKLPSFLGGGSDSGGVDLAGISGDLVNQVEQVFARHGFTGAEWQAAKWIIQKESGWDPAAVNPSSGAFGLFQFNPMGGDTLGQYLPDRNPDPAVQANAGARYMKDRYGSPTAAKAWWEKNNWYDEGGEAAGVGVLQKNVLQPERVLSPRQTRAFNDFVYALMPAMIESWRQNPPTLERGFRDVVNAVAALQGSMQSQRNAEIEATAEGLLEVFDARSKGQLETNPIDYNLDEGWWDRNGDKLETNLTEAFNRSITATNDPWAYLESERLAREALDARHEAEREKLEEERDKEREEKEKAEEEARKEREKAEDEEAKTDEEREALKAQREAEKEERDAKKKAEQDAIQEREKAEEERIAALKESGEFYYGFKVLDDEGNNPDAWEPTEHEQAVRKGMEEAASTIGMGPLLDNALAVADSARMAEADARMWSPAIMAAANGDSTGLAHNLAAQQAAVLGNARAEWADMGPTALAQALEMAMSMDSGAPVIGEVHTGVSEARLYEVVDKAMRKGSRGRGGTARPRA